MAIKKKYLNSTYLDEIAARYSLRRGKDESIESFLQRVYKASKNPLSQKREDIYDSMGYVTPLREKHVVEIGLVEDTQSRIKITSSKIYVWTDKTQAPVIDKELKEYKFLEDLYADLGNYIDTFTLRQLDSYSPYLKSINLMPFDTDQNYREYIARSEISKLPEKFVDQVVDFNGFLEEKLEPSLQSNRLNNSNQYILDRENQLFYKKDLNPETITFNYRKFPVNLVWLPIKVSFLDDEDFDYFVLDKDNNGQPRFLSQEGAKIYNKLLKISNTYWGK